MTSQEAVGQSHTLLPPLLSPAFQAVNGSLPNPTHTRGHSLVGEMILQLLPPNTQHTYTPSSLKISICRPQRSSQTPRHVLVTSSFSFCRSLNPCPSSLSQPTNIPEDLLGQPQQVLAIQRGPHKLQAHYKITSTLHLFFVDSKET